MRDLSALRDEILRFDPEVPIERAWMPPASWYVDPDLHQLERSALLRTWQPVLRAAELPSTVGAYVSGCLFGEPWVIVRGEDGEARAFHNVCRHKGREVVTGTGVGEQLVCGYHAWRYDLSGRLKSAPRIGGALDFDRDEMGLSPMRAQAWGPWLFINCDPQAQSIEADFPELDAQLSERGFAQLTLVGTRRWVIECNWKVYIDNYLDGGYHIPHMHPTLDAQLEMAGYRTETFERSSIQTSPPAAKPDDRIDYDAKDRIGPGAIYGWMYPNFMLNRYGPCLDSNYVLPLGVDRCEVLYEFYFEEGRAGAEDFIKASMQQSDVTQREDIEICESVQRGLKSMAYDRGRYAPRVENGEHHFHCLLQRDLVRRIESERERQKS